MVNGNRVGKAEAIIDEASSSFHKCAFFGMQEDGHWVIALSDNMDNEHLAKLRDFLTRSLEDR